MSAASEGHLKKLCDKDSYKQAIQNGVTHQLMGTHVNVLSVEVQKITDADDIKVQD